MSTDEQDSLDSAAESRRKILKKFGRYAAAATPAMIMLLESNRQEAMAQNAGRGGRGRGNGRGRGGGRPNPQGGNPGRGNQGNSKPVGNAP